MLRIDHKALAAIFNSAMSVSSRVTKWLLALQPFDFAIEVIAGKQNGVADSLSRIPWPITLPNADTSDDFVELVDADSESASQVGSDTSLTLPAIETLKQHQSQETDIVNFKQWIAT